MTGFVQIVVNVHNQVNNSGSFPFSCGLNDWTRSEYITYN